MRNTITAVLFGIALCTFAFTSVGCGKDKKKEISCEQVTDHFVKLAPDNMKKYFENKDELIKNCKDKTSAEERKCIMGSKDFKAAMSCRKKPTKKG